MAAPSISRRVVTGGRPTRGNPVVTGSLWTLVAPCANIRRTDVREVAVSPTTTADPAVETAQAVVPTATVDDDVLAEVLVEEISIDGMCGVY
jgi:mycofactocin precursor